jgi:hypothetical protein
MGSVSSDRQSTDSEPAALARPRLRPMAYCRCRSTQAVDGRAGETETTPPLFGAKNAAIDPEPGYRASAPIPRAASAYTATVRSVKDTDRVLEAADKIIRETGRRTDAEAIRSQVGENVDVMAALRDLSADGYVEIIAMWQGDAIVRAVTPEGRRRLADATPAAQARRAADRFVVPIVVAVVSGVLGALALHWLVH